MKRGTSNSYGDEHLEDVFQLHKKKRKDKAIEGTSDVVSSIKVVEATEWFHVSRFDPGVDTEEMKKWMAGILDNTKITCIKLLPRNRNQDELTFISFKLGVEKSLADKVLDPSIWPKNVTVKSFESRPYNSTKNFHLPHLHMS